MICKNCAGKDTLWTGQGQSALSWAGSLLWAIVEEELVPTLGVCGSDLWVRFSQNQTNVHDARDRCNGRRPTGMKLRLVPGNRKEASAFVTVVDSGR